MNEMRKMLKKIPVLPSVHRRLREKLKAYRRSLISTESIFSDIYRQNAWKGTESISGTGSTADQTDIIVKQLPLLLQKYEVKSMLDLPCGDFHWMKNVDLGSVDYVGADIVSDLINENNKRYGRDRVRFRKLDLIKDELPAVDLIFCRDCLVHLSFSDVLLALQNVCHSNARYLLTTTFADRQENHDILTGEWRTLNIQLAPINLPKPIELINENCSEGNGEYRDKSLGLWAVSEVRESLGVSTGRRSWRRR